MKKHLRRAWTAFLVVCFPLHALLRVVAAKDESEIAGWPFLGTACKIGFGLILAAVAGIVLLTGLQAAVIVIVATALYAFAMVDYFKKVLKAKASAA